MTAAVLRGGIGHPQRSFIHNSSLQPVSKSSSARVSQLSFVRSKHRPRSARHQAFVSNSAQHAVSTATAAVAGLGSVGTQVTSSLQSCLDSAVLLATVGASFKLFLICAAVGWLLRNKKIPNSTATVLSQVSFQLVIPAMLFSKVAFTLAAQPSGSLLLVTVVVTLAQICLGAFFGRALAPLVDGQYSRDRTILGWHPLNPARSASAIAASVGTATGVPLALQTLVLASSLLAQGGGGAMKGAGTGSGVSGSPGGVSSWVRALKQEVLPGDAMEGRALAVLSLVRFLLVPLGTLGVLWALRRAGALAAVDPVLIFVLLVEAVMPSAQNLIILLQLSERTQSAAPGFARLLLKLYAYAVLPVTLWVTAFATRLAIPVLR